MITYETKDASATETTRRESRTPTVRERIEAMILREVIVTGERWNENTFATQLEVSRGLIRDATRLLAEARLVTMIHNRGVFVREIKLEEVLQVYDVRAGLAHAAGEEMTAARVFELHLMTGKQRMLDSLA